MSSVDSALHHQLATLYSDHHGWLQGWLRGRLGDAFTAADLAQDTFVSVIRDGHAGEIREPRPFLATIARRLMSHHHRRQLLEASYLEALALLPAGLAPSPEEKLLAVEALQQIDTALDGLPAPVREAFLLAHLELLSYAEIAERLGVSASSVKQYLSRANQQCFFAMGAGRLEALKPQAAYQSLSLHAQAAHGTARPSRRRRGLLMWFGVAGVAGAGVAGSRSNTWQQATADHRTRTGEQRELTLADGTRLRLNTDSAVNVRFDADRRRVQLVAGEAMIVTGHARGGGGVDERPFVVETAEGLVRALGTRFSVRQLGGQTRVAVLESAVEITRAGAPGEPVLLRAGQGLSLTREAFGERLPVDEQAAAWTRNQIVADDMRLDDFVAELSRYRPGLLRCDPAVGGLRFSGVLPLDDTDRILASLPHTLPVKVRLRTRYWVTIEAASAPGA